LRSGSHLPMRRRDVAPVDWTSRDLVGGNLQRAAGTPRAPGDPHAPEQSMPQYLGNPAHRAFILPRSGTHEPKPSSRAKRWQRSESPDEVLPSLGGVHVQARPARIHGTWARIVAR
jgi:hypothetical protein